MFDISSQSKLKLNRKRRKIFQYLYYKSWPACGAIILNNNTQICHRPFTQEERVLCSTHRELIAIDYSLKAFGPILSNSRVKWFTDSQSSVRIVEVGSMQFSLHTLAIGIFEFCIRNNIELSVQWFLDL